MWLVCEECRHAWAHARPRLVLCTAAAVSFHSHRPGLDGLDGLKLLEALVLEQILGQILGQFWS